jgi:outer membrane receptor protein involved in Fe transport
LATFDFGIFPFFAPKTNNYMLKRLTILLLAISVSYFAFAQVTTSSITGTAKSANGEALVGATITATHLPSGTVYSTIAQKDGSFTLPGLRVGGPYTIVINFVGLKAETFNNVALQLGEAYNITATLGIEEKELTGVVVTGRGRKTSTDKGGMSTVINSRMLATMPTISRSITDFTRATPQANGNNFGGRDAKYNNITVDGANLNNNFGLSSDPLPGGGNNPVSLDAIEEVSVSLAPYDVRQGNFTGGNIAAITKSGTNTYHGTAYIYWQNQNLRGDQIAGQKASNPKFESKVYGASVGGPIIKNKLFFFINGEYETKPPSAGITWSPKGGSGEGNVSDVPVDSLERVSNYLKTQQEYDPGVYDNFPAFKNENRKLLGKIDWNISSKHKLTVKYSDFKGTQDFSPSQSGNIAGTFSGATYGPKFSSSAMGFSSTLYQQEDIVQSAAVELNSKINSRMSNQFLATYTKNQSDKSHEGANFPFIDILGATTGDTRNFISVGNEPFNGNNNKVHNDIYNVIDNFSYFVGKHALTAGISYEYQKVGNMFMAGSQGYYVFRNVDDFVNNRAPLKFAQTYSLIKGQDAVFSAQLKIGQLSAYVQDEINASSNLRFTVGIRMDKPIYPEQPLENPANSAIVYKNEDGKSTSFSNGKWPKASALFSPRVGFRWDLYGDKSLIIRGGTGIFTGRIPFVWLTNIPTNSGMYQFSANVTSANANMSNYKFDKSPTAYNPFYNSSLPANLFPTVAGTAPSANFVAADPNYKFPQVWRTDLAFEQQLGKNWKVTVEALYTKDINATYMYDANQNTPTETVTTGSHTRSRYTLNTNSTVQNQIRRINPGITNAIVLASTNKGSSFVFTTQLEKTFSKGLYASLAYTYNFARNLTENPGSQAASVYNANVTEGTLNDLELAYAQFAVPHRIIGNVSYHFEYAKHLGTTICFIYEGAHNGTYSYIYSGSINNQGQNSSNLMYVPTDATNPSEIKFVDRTYNGQLYTATTQAQIFERYIQQDPYLRDRRGKVVERNGAKRPWYNRLDMKFIQDIFTNVGSRRHTIQFSADVYNVANLINHDWGARKIYTINNPLTLSSVTNGIPSFTITPYNGLPVTQTFINTISTSNTWAMQLGLRYIF